MDEKMIKSPKHYTEGRKFEPKDVIRDWGLNFNLGNAVKYLARAGRKGDAVEDLKKAQQYIQFEIDALEAEGKEPKKAGCYTKMLEAMKNCEGEVRDIPRVGVIELEVGKDFDPSQVAKIIMDTIIKTEQAEEDEQVIPVTVEVLGDMKRVSYKNDEVEVPADVSTEDALAFLLAHFGETGEE